jgi:UPF0716 protein FxsA
MNIGRLLLISLISLPFLEIYLIIKLAGSLGFFLCLTLIIASALAGIALIRVQGTTALVRAQQAIAQGQLPAHEIIDSGIMGLAAVFLIIPGFISDIAALICLMPSSRAWLTEYLLSRSINIQTKNANPDSHTTLEGEFHRED